MITLKFGGTSMGSARRILDSADIMLSRAKDSRISVVVSAVAGVSNKLQSAIDSCVAGGQPAEFVEEIRGTHQSICSEIKGVMPEFRLDAVNETIDKRLSKLEKLLSALVTLGECSASAHCRIMGMGEQMSSPIVEEVLRAKGQSVVLLDSRKFIYATGDQKEGDPDYIRSADAFSAYRDNAGGAARILLFPGFICTWNGGTDCKDQPGLLGRNGSDFSAAIIGSCLGASKVEFWTDVEGIYTADPRIVRDAVLVKDMSYEEAMELSFFGSRVLHPKTLAPLLQPQGAGHPDWPRPLREREEGRPRPRHLLPEGLRDDLRLRPRHEGQEGNGGPHLRRHRKRGHLRPADNPVLLRVHDIILRPQVRRGPHTGRAQGGVLA